MPAMRSPRRRWRRRGPRSASSSPAAARAAPRMSACSRCSRSCTCRSTASPAPAWARSSARPTRRARRSTRWRRSLASITTRELFTELPPREDRAVRLKQDDRTVLSPIELGLRRRRGARCRKAWSRAFSSRRVLRRLSKVRRLHRLRRPADSVSRRRDRPRHRQGGRPERRRARQRDARQHVGAGRDRAGAPGRPSARRRRADRQPAGRRRALDGRRHRHRRQPRHAAAQCRSAQLGARRH